MFKTLLKYVFIGFLVWLFLTKSGIRLKTETANKEAFGALLPRSEYAPECRELIERGVFDRATACYKQALIGNVTNPEIRYYLAVSMLADKDFEGAKFHSEFIMKNLPKSRYAPYARKVFNMAIVAAKEKEILETESDSDYIADLDAIHPWRKMPIKVWIQHSDNNANLRRAFSIWQTALYPTISFKMVSTKEEGNIVVIFDDPTVQCSSEFAVGCTKSYVWKKDRNHTAGAVISLASHTPNGVKVTDNELFSTLSHEIGHALGMSGHSKNRSDIMYPDTSNYNRRLSKRDINTVRKIYGR